MRILSPILALSLALSPCASNADLLGGSAAGLGAYFGGREVRKGAKDIADSISRAASLAVGIQNEMDDDIRDYLKEAERLLYDLQTAAESQVRFIMAELKAVEEKAYNDLQSLIQQTECAAVRTVDDTFRAVRDILPDIIEGQRRKIKLPYPYEEGTNFFGSPITHTHIIIDLQDGLKADDELSEIEKGMLKSINSIDETDTAYGIISGYSYLSLLSQKTVCIYEKTAAKDIFVRKAAEYDALTRPWVQVLNVEFIP